jgi:hypothetical protein
MDKKVYWFSGMIDPMPAEKFDTSVPVVSVPEYECGKFPGVPCTMALCMRHCASCVVIRR